MVLRVAERVAWCRIEEHVREIRPAYRVAGPHERDLVVLGIVVADATKVRPAREEVALAQVGQRQLSTWASR